MTDRKRKRQADPPLQQDSRFLLLPAEIRNRIIGEAYHNPKTLAIAYLPESVVKPSAHPLLHTCRQLRNEFSESWAANGLAAAATTQTIVCHTRNFDIGEILNSELKKWLAALPQLADGGKRKFVLQAHLNHTFELSMFMCKWWAADRAKHINFHIKVQLGSMASEVSYLGHFLRHHHGILVPDISKALEDAVVRHEGRQAGRKGGQQKLQVYWR